MFFVLFQKLTRRVRDNTDTIRVRGTAPSFGSATRQARRCSRVNRVCCITRKPTRAIIHIMSRARPRPLPFPQQPSQLPPQPRPLKQAIPPQQLLVMKFDA